MKFAQLIEYNMRNIFLEKSYHKCGGETSPRLFYKKSHLSDLLIENLKCYKFVLLLYWFAAPKQTYTTRRQK